jgi:peptidoglycan/xylan/chitin deacetylase (PgdA/CDA1 family)
MAQVYRSFWGERFALADSEGALAIIACMRFSHLLAALALAASTCAITANAQIRTVALTIDDLPFITGDSSRPMNPSDAETGRVANTKLLTALATHHVPVTGFVIQKGVEALGLASGTEVLRDWTGRGFDLGNHSYAHPDFNGLTVEQFEDQIVRGEATIVPLMLAAHRKVEFFRFPFNHTGDTQQKHDAVAVFLAERGYKLAPCTIETEDWEFNAAYFLMRSRHDEVSAARLRADYLAFTAAQIDYFAGLHRQVLGYDPPQIMLIHDNQLNADLIEDMLAIFEEKRYQFVSLTQAEDDPAYKTAETYITDNGPMWGYRWARERNVKVDGSKEPKSPAWIAEYGKESSKP